MSEDLDSYDFRKGAEVEISSNDDGFRGAWYAGTVVRLSRSKNNRTNHLVLVEYKTIMADESGSKPLRETVDVIQLRPPPPREKRGRNFKFSEEVDAYYNDGWWEGVITDIIPGNRYSVFFRATREQLEFGHSELRLHREWVYGKWVPPLEEEEEEEQVPIPKVIKLRIEDNDRFNKGTQVEVSSDEDGFQGAWFAAAVIEQLSDGNFLVEYKCLRNDDDTEFLREVVDSLHIRPHPPDTEVVDSFRPLEEVDALYNDGWWVGVISRVLCCHKYVVYFRGTKEEMVFEQSDLRPHLEWTGGKWTAASRFLKL